MSVEFDEYPDYTPSIEKAINPTLKANINR
jgi:hypothetical protein